MNATSIHLNQHIDVHAWVTNTIDSENNVTATDGWPSGFGLWGFGCNHPHLWPLRLGLATGHYTQDNVSEAGWLMPAPSNLHCSAFPIANLTSFLFMPSNSSAMISYNRYGQTYVAKAIPIEATQSIPGPMFPSLSAGKYTVIVGDEWGHLAFATFSIDESG